MYKLLRKYDRGRVSANKIVDGLAALRAQNLANLADDMLLEAMDLVRPVPTALWKEACRRMVDWNYRRLRYMFTLARANKRYTKHLVAHKTGFLDRKDGVLAVFYELAHHQTPWANALLHEAFESLQSTISRSGV